MMKIGNANVKEPKETRKEELLAMSLGEKSLLELPGPTAGS